MSMYTFIIIMDVHTMRSPSVVNNVHYNYTVKSE
jgi:hypothetical protein